MTKVLVGSENPVKIKAVEEVFSKYFDNLEVVAIKVDSKVSSQPVNDETFEGAKNRALELKRINKEENLGAKFFVGIEGGIINLASSWFVIGGICIVDIKGNIGYGSSPLFEIPKSIANKLLDGVELGDVMDNITGKHNIKKKEGAIGFFTKGVMDRKNLYVNGLITALIPFLNEDLYFE